MRAASLPPSAHSTLPACSRRAGGTARRRRRARSARARHRAPVSRARSVARAVPAAASRARADTRAARSPKLSTSSAGRSAKRAAAPRLHGCGRGSGRSIRSTSRRSELRGAAAAAGKNGETVAADRVQAAVRRRISGGTTGISRSASVVRKGVFLEDLGVGPARRAIELGHHEAGAGRVPGAGSSSPI